MARQDAAPPVIETRGLSKRYRRVTALSEATITMLPSYHARQATPAPPSKAR